MVSVIPPSRAGSLLQLIYGEHKSNVGVSLLAMRPAASPPIQG